MNDDPPRDLDAAYKTYRPLLFAALARIGKSGIEIPFGDGLDIVHDFFIEEFSAIRDRYDPAKGRFTTYLFAAFSRFARTRAVRAARFKPLLPDEQELAASLASESLDAERVREALATLASGDRQLLVDYFDATSSERELAEKHATSRHQIRERIVDTLGRLVVAIGDRGHRNPRDWKLAIAHWGERRSLEDAAAIAGMTYAQARHARARMIADFRLFQRS